MPWLADGLSAQFCLSTAGSPCLSITTVLTPQTRSRAESGPIATAPILFGADAMRLQPKEAVSPGLTPVTTQMTAADLEPAHLSWVIFVDPVITTGTSVCRRMSSLQSGLSCNFELTS